MMLACGHYGNGHARYHNNRIDSSSTHTSLIVRLTVDLLTLVLMFLSSDTLHLLAETNKFFDTFLLENLRHVVSYSSQYVCGRHVVSVLPFRLPQHEFYYRYNLLSDKIEGIYGRKIASYMRRMMGGSGIISSCSCAWNLAGILYIISNGSGVYSFDENEVFARKTLYGLKNCMDTGSPFPNDTISKITTQCGMNLTPRKDPRMNCSCKMDEPLLRKALGILSCNSFQKRRKTGITSV